MINIYEASGYMFFKKTGEPINYGSDECPTNVFCYGPPDYWYWYRANGKCYRMSEANIPNAVKMAMMLLKDL